jgi:hypothetical protein
MAVLPVHSDYAGGDCRKNENALQPLSEYHNSLKTDWQSMSLAFSGYLELGHGGQEVGYGRGGCQPFGKG